MSRNKSKEKLKGRPKFPTIHSEPTNDDHGLRKVDKFLQQLWHVILPKGHLFGTV